MQIDSQKCIACRVCEETCPVGAIAFPDRKARRKSPTDGGPTFNPTFSERCVQCNLCAAACPTKAIVVSTEIIEGTARCDHCPVRCQIREGYKGGCQRYTNAGGLIETAEPLKFPERETVEEFRKNFVLSVPLVSAVGAGSTYPDFLPAPIQAEERVNGIDVVTVVTGAPLTYSSILVKIDTNKPVGEEGAPVFFKKRQVGHVTTQLVRLQDDQPWRHQFHEEGLQYPARQTHGSCGE